MQTMVTFQRLFQHDSRGWSFDVKISRNPRVSGFQSSKPARGRRMQVSQLDQSLGEQFQWLASDLGA